MDLQAEALRLKAEGLNNVEIGQRLGISRDAVYRLLKKAEQDGETLGPPETIILDVDHIDDIDDLLAERGLNRDNWIIVSVIVNKWEGFAKQEDGSGIYRVPLRQLKVTLRPKVDVALLVPGKVAPLPRLRTLASKRINPRNESKLVFVYGDDQRPNTQAEFEWFKLTWVRRHQPDVIVDLGDGMDFPTVSGHKTNPAMNWSVQECVDNYTTWLWRLRDAAPNAEIVILADNHVTGRLRDYQLAHAAALYGVHPAKIEGLADDLEPLMSVPRMLRLDELGIRYIQPAEDTHYAESHYEIVPGELVALHGYRTGANLGKKFIDDYGTSVVYGHAHQQDVYVTDHQRRGIGKRRRLAALGVGCGARIDGGGGFAPGADWQQNALTVTVFPDGGWTWDYMDFAHGVMRWRDEMYDDPPADVMGEAA